MVAELMGAKTFRFYHRYFNASSYVLPLLYSLTDVVVEVAGSPGRSSFTPV
jgi:hypothetical protein